MPRTIAIGDIHGCATALEKLLEEIKPTASDTLIGIGDYVDRGMESSRVIDILIELVARCRFIPLIGNHEIMMYRAIVAPAARTDYQFWYQHGGNATLASYGGEISNIPQHHLTFLSHCQRYFETDTHFFLHANYEPDVLLDKQPDEVIFWQHIGPIPPGMHRSGKVGIVGHTPQPEGEILDLGHLKVIDTYCYGDQWLTAVDVGSGQVWQANNRGQFRTSQMAQQEELYADPPNQNPGDAV